MRTWKRLVALSLVFALASSFLCSAELHWRFWDEKETGKQEAAMAILETGSKPSVTDSTQTAQTEPKEPLRNSDEESLALEPTGFEDLSDAALIEVLEDSVDDMNVAVEIKDEGYVVVSAQYEAKVADYEKLREENALLKNKLAPFKVEIRPELLYTFGENPWGAGISVGFIYNNAVLSVGVDKTGIRDLGSFRDPNGYTLRMGAGFIF